MLEFDAETRKILDVAYAGSDVVRRRMENFRALDARPGETILDLGCGTGPLTQEIARTVGGDGRVIGVDPSPEMRAGALDTCKDQSNVSILDGTATRIPAPDAGIDRIVSVNVFEYLDDIPAALTEAARVLKPGGRLVIGDWHWDCLAWASSDDERMRRMMTSWDNHLVERCVPALLPRVLKDAGFVRHESRPVTFTDTSLRQDGVALMMIYLMSAYARKHNHLPPEEIDAWARDQRERAEHGTFFFSFTYYVTVAHRL